MPRKGAAPRRVIRPDTVFGNVTVSRLVNKVMQRGKKSLAEHIVYGAFDEVKSKAGQDPAKVLDKALGNIMTLLEVRPERRMSLGLCWLVDHARQRKDRRSMAAKLAAELLDASAGQGGAVKKREDTHRMAEANKAFAHYRW